MDKMLWYGADEVKIFHPIVEECINNALSLCGFSDKYYVKHHYGQHTTGIPDFTLHDKQTDDYICIIEVKKTPTETLGQEAGYQARNYTKQLYPLRWKLDYLPNFCVTNIEYTQFYGLRENSTPIGCLLENSPKLAGSIDSSDLRENFTKILAEYFLFIDKKTEHSFSMHLEAISESFNQSFYNIAQILNANFKRITNFVNANENLRRGVLYELFRFAFYYYIKEYYLLSNNKLADYFNDFESSHLNADELVQLINANFDKAMIVDFVNLLKNYETNNPLYPNMILANEELGKIFSNFIQTLESNAEKGIQKNSSLLNYLALITSDIYNKDEMHSTGKIMSDEVLSDVLTRFTVNSENDTVFDPCCGDGNLLVSAYKRKRQLDKNKSCTHNKLLNEIFGIDIDPNLIQLSAFKLIGQDLDDVNSETVTNLDTNDFILTESASKYKAVVMNPPYLRNEDLSNEDKISWLQSIESSIKQNSFIRDVSQPNHYYFFIEKAVHSISDDGSGAFILMSKFLNNKDGEPLKKFLKPYLDAIIHYPPSFFEGFKVTTDIFILKHPSRLESKVSFLNVKDTSLLADLDILKKLISEKKDSSNSKFTLVNINRDVLASSSNWRLYLIDPYSKYQKFTQLKNIKPIGSFFNDIVRGKADNAGGSAFIFPFSGNNELIDLVKNVEDEFIGLGLQRNKLSKGRRRFQLTKSDLLGSRGLHLPKDLHNNLDKFEEKLKPGITSYLLAMKDKLASEKFRQVVSNTVNSLMKPNILIPRGDRAKHSVYYYPDSEEPSLISTNFFSLSGFNSNNVHSNENSTKFIAAFLLSSFGQIQFEIHGNDQEGDRKIEKRNIEEFNVPDPALISVDELNKTLDAFNSLNDLNSDFIGIEHENVRNELDEAIAEILFKRSDLGFKTSQDLKLFFQDFLKELVISRVKI